MPVSALHGGLFHLYPAADPVKYRPHWEKLLFVMESPMSLRGAVISVS